MSSLSNAQMLKAYSTHSRKKMPAEKWLTIRQTLRESKEYQATISKSNTSITKVPTWKKQ